MIRIVNWLLTRKCNLRCDYCRIVKEYDFMPSSYPRIDHYYKNEMSKETIINGLANFKNHNEKIFHIFYGGEPLLRPDLPEIIEYCNEEDIEYTIISNNTKTIQPMIEKLFENTSEIKGFTSSIDPDIMMSGFNETSKIPHQIQKSLDGFTRLKDMYKKGFVKDVVAEITVTNNNQNMLIPLIEKLTDTGIYSSITFVDIAKSNKYDFSNITEIEKMVKPTLKLARIFEKIIGNDNLLIHMKYELLDQIFEYLPSNYDCKLENKIHNITVDADGRLRLCLRIRGDLTPTVHINNLFEEESLFTPVTKEFYNLLTIDKKRLCKLCNHTCMMMSNTENYNNLIHIDRRS